MKQTCSANSRQSRRESLPIISTTAFRASLLGNDPQLIQFTKLIQFSVITPELTWQTYSPTKRRETPNDALNGAERAFRVSHAPCTNENPQTWKPELPPPFPCLVTLAASFDKHPA
jgi:hypothetical protein